MTGRTTVDVVRQTEALHRAGTVAGMSDPQLLDRFLGARGEASELAFRALVTRHGPMVLGVCRRILRRQHDAEDAFQATFLVLVRNAGKVRTMESLGPWLYGVSRRVAGRAQVVAARRQSRETSEIERLPARLVTADFFDLRVLLDEEINRLPLHQRTVVVLCDLQGLSQEDAASTLKCPLGTIKSRLSRARERLRERLARRGVTPAVVFLTPRWLRKTVPPPLVDAAVEAAAGVASSRVADLAKGVMKGMILTKLQMIVAAIVLVGVPSTGVLLLAQDTRPVVGGGADAAAKPKPLRPSELQPERNPAIARTHLPRTRSEKGNPSAYVVEPPDKITVEVLETLAGRPITGWRQVRPDGTITLGFYGDISVAGLTTTEIKVRVIEHLRKWISDEALGLIEKDPRGELRIAPEASSAVFVDVQSYESKFYYVDGDVKTPGRWPVTGRETLRDALQAASALLPSSDRDMVRLIREGPIGAAVSVTHVKYRDLIFGTDPAINQSLRPGDRIVVLRDSRTSGRSLIVPEQRGANPEPTGQAAASPSTRSAIQPYVVQPPDVLIVELLQALPGRPVTGERLVRPDGTISLGFYGDLPVAGLTLSEIKERLIEHFKTWLSDDALGLSQTDPKTGAVKQVAPRDTTSVFVDVSSFNSLVFYVSGDVKSPGRFPFTGRDSVRDALCIAGGLAGTGERIDIKLIRPSKPGAPESVIPVDYQELLLGTGAATNPKLLPGDRLIVTGKAVERAPEARPAAVQDSGRGSLHDRVENVERKLDQVLEELRALRQQSKP